MVSVFIMWYLHSSGATIGVQGLGGPLVVAGTWGCGREPGGNLHEERNDWPGGARGGGPDHPAARGRVRGADDDHHGGGGELPRLPRRPPTTAPAETTTTAPAETTTTAAPAAYDINTIVAGIKVDETIVVPDKYKGAAVKVGSDAPYPPWEMFVGETDQFTGFDYDLAQAMGAKLGVKFEFVRHQVRQPAHRPRGRQHRRHHVEHVRRHDPPEAGRLRRLRQRRHGHAGR